MRMFVGGKSRQVALSLACGVLLASATAVRAGDLANQGDPVAALQNYIQLAELAQPNAPAAAVGKPTAGDDAVGKLRSYMQSLDATQPSQPTTAGAALVSDRDFAGDVYAPLKAFSQKLSAEQQPAIEDLPKVAEAGSLMEWLQQGGHDEAPAAAPATAPKGKGKSIKAKRASEPVPATAVGSKVCLGCHSDQAAAFSGTLMGRLQLQGKMDCETCHGPGSAHVKAGGGRGVGGIISFRTDDNSRTPDENNALCLGCHDKGQRIFGRAACTKSAICLAPIATPS